MMKQYVGTVLKQCIISLIVYYGLVRTFRAPLENIENSHIVMMG